MGTRNPPSAKDAAGAQAAETEAAGAWTAIELELPDAPPARFRLLWQEAPRTCAAATDALPERAECFHAIYSGTIAGFLLNPEAVAPVENATTCIIPGDLLYTHYEPGFRHGHHNPLSEIYWAYDRYARPTIPGQFVPVAGNVFGAYDGPPDVWSAFADRCKRLRFEGTVTLQIRCL